MQNEFNTTAELIEDIRNGKIVVLVDDEDRENEGDLVLAADHVNAQMINFMAVEARGLICLSLTAAQVEKLALPQMVREDMNYSPNKTAFTVSIEAAEGVSTGISAADRAHTIRVAANPNAKAADVTMPGHVFPIRAQAGGVLRRAGHTEGSVDLARLAGLNPAAVICEVMNPDGTMARVSDLRGFAKKHGLKMGTIVDLIQYRLQNESLVEEVLTQEWKASAIGDVKLRIFKSKVDAVEHIVIQKGDIDSSQPVLVRMQVDNYAKDLAAILHSNTWTASKAAQRMAKESAGLMILLRGNNKANVSADFKALLNPETLNRAFSMDEREYGIGAQILRALGVQKIKLLTNKPEKRVGLRAFDIEIVDVVSFES